MKIIQTWNQGKGTAEHSGSLSFSKRSARSKKVPKRSDAASLPCESEESVSIVSYCSILPVGRKCSYLQTFSERSRSPPRAARSSSSTMSAATSATETANQNFQTAAEHEPSEILKFGCRPTTDRRPCSISAIDYGMSIGALDRWY